MGDLGNWPRYEWGETCRYEWGKCTGMNGGFDALDPGMNGGKILKFTGMNGGNYRYEWGENSE
jgi:hypothetical protein